MRRAVHNGVTNDLSNIVDATCLAARRAWQGSQVDHVPRRSVRYVRSPKEGVRASGVAEGGVTAADHLAGVVDAVCLASRRTGQGAEVGQSARCPVRRGRRPEKGASRKVRTGGADHLTAIVDPARHAARRASQGYEDDRPPRRALRGACCPEEATYVAGYTDVGIATADHLH